MNKCLLTLLFLSFTCCVLGQKKLNIPRDTTEVSPLKILDIVDPVSIINLIATPEKYHGKKIQIIGYLHLEFEGDAIFLNKDDCLHTITTNGLWVNFSEKLSKETNLQDYNDNYVIILGTFNQDSKGHMGLWNATMDNIVRLDFWGLKK
jgi:hypothetical protein